MGYNKRTGSHNELAEEKKVLTLENISFGVKDEKGEKEITKI